MGTPLIIEGDLDASGRRFAIVASRFNNLFCERLIRGALDALTKHGAVESDITIIRVPGSFEIPLAALEIAQSGSVDAIIALGVLIKGDTDHYTLIANEVSRGLGTVMSYTGVPVSFGVIPATTTEQVDKRTSGDSDNKGWEAALAAIQMVNVVAAIRKR